MARWDDKAANTFDKHLSALNSFAAYCRRQEWLTTDPGRRLERRQVTARGTRSYPWPPRPAVHDRSQLRERVLWRMLYETCARADEILGLDVPDLEMEFSAAP
jgi:site-specific recombinase XerD